MASQQQAWRINTHLHLERLAHSLLVSLLQDSLQNVAQGAEKMLLLIVKA
jgi:hypothetical protein